jgi:hypothetical protein
MKSRGGAGTLGVTRPFQVMQSIAYRVSGMEIPIPVFRNIIATAATERLLRACPYEASQASCSTFKLPERSGFRMALAETLGSSQRVQSSRSSTATRRS